MKSYNKRVPNLTAVVFNFSYAAGMLHSHRNRKEELENAAARHVPGTAHLP
jgi:hypothetical protein